jgi:hypothetical protein
VAKGEQDAKKQKMFSMTTQLEQSRQIISRYLRVLWLLGLITVPCSPATFAEPLHGAQAAKSLAACIQHEDWGIARYTAREKGGIEYHAEASKQPSRLARVIPTPGPMALCHVIEAALIFVVPDQGVFQVDRRIDSDAAPFWLAPVPDHFSPASRFEQTASSLTLVTGHFTTVIETEDEVRNDVVPELSPTMELNLPVAIEPPLALDHSQAIWPAGRHFYVLSTEGLVPTAAPILQIEQHELLIVHGKQRHVIPTGLQVNGYCATRDELVVFDGMGQILRLRRGSAATDFELLGRFQLDSAVQACQIDDDRQRLYVANESPVLWVFNLVPPGLAAPRAVTSDWIVDSLNGVALYGSEFVLTQSSGDHAILVFAAEDMVLRKRFRIRADLARGLDGVSSSGGLAAIRTALPGFPRGALLVHDALNRLPEAPANLKILDWRDIDP